MIEKKKISGIKTWPEDDRPREKLLRKGAGVLSNSELLAILLRTGTNGTSATKDLYGDTMLTDNQKMVCFEGGICHWRKSK